MVDFKYHNFNFNIPIKNTYGWRDDPWSAVASHSIKQWTDFQNGYGIIDKHKLTKSRCWMHLLRHSKRATHCSCARSKFVPCIVVQTKWFSTSYGANMSSSSCKKKKVIKLLGTCIVCGDKASSMNHYGSKVCFSYVTHWCKRLASLANLKQDFILQMSCFFSAIDNKRQTTQEGKLQSFEQHCWEMRDKCQNQIIVQVF